MPQPSPEELERLHAEIVALADQAATVLAKVGLSDEEKTWAREASQHIARFAISLWTELRNQPSPPKVRMHALSAAVASALAVVDGNARATDAFDNR